MFGGLFIVAARAGPQMRMLIARSRNELCYS